jgi:chromosome partitioning protein
MSKILAFANHKGGVGKTTCAQNLAACLVEQHQRKVLAIDLDSQGNLTDGLAASGLNPEKTAFRLLLDPEARLDDYIITLRPGLDVIPNTYQKKVEDLIAKMPEQYWRLNNLLAPIRSAYDVIILDTPPGLGLPTKSAIAAADEVIIVVSCWFYALKGAGTVMGVMMDLQSEMNRSHIPTRVLLNNYDERRNLDRRIKEALEHAFGNDLFRTTIRPNIRIGEAANARQSIVEYSRGSTGYRDFTNLAKEVLGLPLEEDSLVSRTTTRESFQEVGAVVHIAP